MQARHYVARRQTIVPKMVVTDVFFACLGGTQSSHAFVRVKTIASKDNARPTVYDLLAALCAVLPRSSQLLLMIDDRSAID
jgi:hypothetical protein